MSEDVYSIPIQVAAAQLRPHHVALHSEVYVPIHEHFNLEDITVTVVIIESDHGRTYTLVQCDWGSERFFRLTADDCFDSCQRIGIDEMVLDV
jgi:hypothetical protein